LHSVVGVMRAVHRIIEQHVVTQGDEVAIVDGERSCSYRELNSVANSLARRMIGSGFRRGMRADVHMPPSVDLAVVLLAILKAGGCYTWTYDDRPSFEIGMGDTKTVVAVDGITVRCSGGGPNLPVVTRDTDIACLLPHTPAGTVAVPHATIVSMAACAAPGQWPWAGEPGAFDLWAALLSGATAVVTEPPAAFALRATA
jgi:non-ribosomal peptide synthetase component F